MTEAEWLATQKSEELLLWLGAGRSHQWPARKSGMFAVACAARFTSFMPDAITLRGLELAEQLAEGVAGEAEYGEYLTECLAAMPPSTSGPESWAWNLSGYTMRVVLPYHTNLSPQKKAIDVCKMCETILCQDGRKPDGAERESSIQAELLRDIFGNPFRPVTFSL